MGRVRLCLAAVLATTGLSIIGTADDQSLPPVDHLIYTTPDLEQGMQEIADLLGVQPIRGGRHAEYGTHNALVSLGPTTYLEIIAPDPDLVRPDRGLLFGLDHLESSRLMTWVLREEDIDTVAVETARAGIDIGPIKAGERLKPDGSVISWKASDPYLMHFGGLVPFLIAWGDTPHPALEAPKAGRLIKLSGQHPNPQAVRNGLAALGIEISVTIGPEPALSATIETLAGRVELR